MVTYLTLPFTLRHTTPHRPHLRHLSCVVCFHEIQRPLFFFLFPPMDDFLLSSPLSEYMELFIVGGFVFSPDLCRR